ncbi:glycoside hydrolase family 16 protein [Hypoxylon crocopeplum]|nr:glycoside hydrolase family 16 protein [Hypoxylon crocopeplum]
MVYPRLFRPLVVISSLAPLSVAAYPEVSSDRCNCFLTNGSNSNWFTTHKFFDFRDKLDDVAVPALIDDPDDSSQASPTNNYLQSNEWADYWTLQSWNNTASLGSTVSDASTLMVHSPNNVYFEKNEDENAGSNTYLTLRTARLEDYQSSSEFESTIRDYHYLSVRMYARTNGAPGAVTAMFTYKDNGDSTDLASVQESDLEIRTLDPPDYIQYTNQPSYTSQGQDLAEATRNVTIPNRRDWTNWAVYRMDWSPDNTTWFIDGDQVASISFQTPRDPSTVIFNAWSDGGSWTGNMSVGQEAHLQVQWIELVYNTTGATGTRKIKDRRSSSETPSHIEKRDEGFCYNVCSIDETSTVGTAVLLQGSASRLLGQLGSFGTIFSWVLVFSIGIAFW